MIFKALRRRSSAAPTAASNACVPEGTRVYAIGDIHGCAHLLDRMCKLIEHDLARAPVAAPAIIFLGDYIDRGPDSAGVLARLSLRDLPAPVVLLRGNHEAMLARFLDDAAFLDDWRNNGGLETLHSFGLSVKDAMRGKGYETLQAQLREQLPPASASIATDAALSHSVGDYFFCHAGVRPGVPLDRQDANDLLWIRQEFLAAPARYDKVIVHGHTPVAAPDNLPGRINVDTGAFATGTLSCVVLEGSARRFLST